MNSVRSNNISLKYQIFTPSSCKNIWVCGKDPILQNNNLSKTLRKYWNWIEISDFTRTLISKKKP